MQRDLYEAEHDMFRDSFRRFLDKEIVPRAEEFERDGIMDRAIFARAGAAGFLAMEAPEEYGGGGVKDFRYNCVVAEEVVRVGGSGVGFMLHNDVVAPYLLRLANDFRRLRTAHAQTDTNIGGSVAPS